MTARCIYADCPREATRTSSRTDPTPTACDLHHFWAVTVLADERYRREPPPVVTDVGIQYRLPAAAGLVVRE